MEFFFQTIVFTFILISILLFTAGRENLIIVKQIVLAISFLQFLLILTIAMFQDFFFFDFSVGQWLGFVTKWTNELLNIYFLLEIDNLTLAFLILSFVLFPICLLMSWNSIKYKFNAFLFTLLAIFFILLCLFCAFDLIYFYIFFESILIPMFILIGVWGSRQRKIHAVYQFFFYTLVSSLFMLLGLVVVYSYLQSTDIRLLYTTNFTLYRQKILWLSFFIAFCVKVPLFPFHIWLPEAHVEAPTVGSVILAGVLLKLGTYGLLRFVVFVFFEATFYFLPFVYTLCIIGIFYTCLSTIRQVDLKKIIAYASVSHMGFVILGLFSFSLYGIVGSFFLMISHGVVSSGLFFLIGCLYDRYKTRLLRYYSGLVSVMPLFSVVFFILILANISMPGTSGFIGEFLILLGLFESSFFATLLSIISIIFTAIYSIWFFNRVIFNTTSSFLINYSDFSKKEFFIGVVFCFLTIFFGFKPAYFILLGEFTIYNLFITT